MKKEIWKDIELFRGINWQGWYQVSNFGQVRSLDRYILVNSPNKTYKQFRKGIVLSLLEDCKGYSFVNLCKSDDKIVKQGRINRLEAIAFGLPIPEHLKHIPIEQLEVDHIDGDRKNNCLDNLRWTDSSGNKKNPITRQRLSDSHKGHYVSENTKEKIRKANSKPILQIDPNTNEVIKEWSSATEVERELGFVGTHISACCRNKRNFCGGFKWKFS